MASNITTEDLQNAPPLASYPHRHLAASFTHAPSEIPRLFGGFGLRDALEKEHRLPRVRKAQPKNWYSFAPHGSSFLYGASFSKNDWVLVNLWIDTKDNSKNELLFDALLEQKDAIESELGFTLEWRRKDGNLSTEVQILRPGSIYDDEDSLEGIRNWMVDNLLAFMRVFEPRLTDSSA